MRTPHAQWLTVHQGDIDQYTSIEILWQTRPNTLTLLVFRIVRGHPTHLTTEEIGPYRSLAELHRELCVLYGEPAARRICQNANSWLPATIMHEMPSAETTSISSDKPQAREYQPQGSLEIVAPGALPSVARIETRKKTTTELLPAFGGQTALAVEVNKELERAEKKTCQRQSTTA
jgi:hypothetical protein